MEKIKSMELIQKSKKKTKEQMHKIWKKEQTVE